MFVCLHTGRTKPPATGNGVVADAAGCGILGNAALGRDGCDSGDATLMTGCDTVDGVS